MGNPHGAPKERPRGGRGAPTRTAQGTPETRKRCADKDCPGNARGADEVCRQGLPKERPRRGRGAPTRTAQGTPTRTAQGTGSGPNPFKVMPAK